MAFTVLRSCEYTLQTCTVARVEVMLQVELSCMGNLGKTSQWVKPANLGVN